MDKRIFCLVAALLALSASFTTASADQVDAYIAARMSELHLPGLSLAVVRDGRIVKLQGYGSANLELGVPVTVATRFEIGSITKQFTAAAVMMLVEEGKVSLDERISLYFPQLPESWGPITVRHLLTHSSGIQEYLLVENLLEESARPGTSHDAIAELFFARLKSEFRPGQTWSYSNSGYLLAGNIIEKVSGKPYFQFLDERIFKPLKMSETRSGEPRTLLPSRAAGYEWREGRFENRPPLTENAYSAGSIVTTPRDLAKWDAAIAGGKLLKKTSWEQTLTPLRISGALAPFNYGFGWWVGQYHGRRFMTHGGGTPGFSSFITRFVDDRITIIVTTNHSDRVLDHLAHDIAGMYVPGLSRPKDPRADPDPARSKRLKNILLDLGTGSATAEPFTPPFQRFLTTGGGKGVWQWVLADGPMTSFTFSEAERTDDAEVIRFKAVLGAVTRWFSFTLTKDGKIAQVAWW
ncbi:MAG TPA: serine hydrolase domain-containing protein [Thermoanaerobaculia bacterium]|nr:serine hydrolase domain-containing protein [Thermoanaerobaculia bacterium]